MRIDLHTHTTASDGLLSPAALVRAALEEKLDVISVCDHDTLDGLEEAERHTSAAGLRLVPGIELSAIWRKTAELHILGYFIAPADARLLGFLRMRREARRTRMQKMLSRLNALGITIGENEVLARAPDGNVGRPHLARVLADRGFVSSADEAFDRYLGEGRPAYVARFDVTPADAIRAIQEAGGLASLAHPGIHNRDEAIPELVAAGLDAIEAHHAKHTPAQTAHYRRVAQRRGLSVTGGSDFHGTMGRDYGPTPGDPCLPEADFLQLLAAAKARRRALGSSEDLAPWISS